MGTYDSAREAAIARASFVLTLSKKQAGERQKTQPPLVLQRQLQFQSVKHQAADDKEKKHRQQQEQQEQQEHDENNKYTDITNDDNLHTCNAAAPVTSTI